MAAFRPLSRARLLVTPRTRRSLPAVLATLFALAGLVLGIRPCVAQGASPAPADSVAALVKESVCGLTRPGDLLLVRGSFGEFRGRAAERGTEGLSGLEPTTKTASPAPTLIRWSEVTSVQRRAGSSTKFAIIGGLLTGAAGALFMGALGSILDSGGEGAMLGFVAFAPPGALVGAAVGTPVPRWKRVYIKE